MSSFKTITLLGSASGRNAGDAALMAAIMQDVDQACGRSLRYEIPTMRPDYVRNHYPQSTRPVGMMPWQGALRMLGIPTVRSLGRADAVIVFDAVLFDRALFNPLFNFMSSLYALLPVARRRGIPVIGYNVGIGPIHTKAGRHMLKSIADGMTFISVRDQDSFALLQEAGTTNSFIRLTADAALNAPSSSPEIIAPIYEAAGIHLTEPKLGININRYLDTWASAGRTSMGREAFLSVFAGAITNFHREFPVPVVLVTTQHHDVEITRSLQERLPSSIRSAVIDNRRHDHQVIKGVLRHLDLLCGMRLHSLILASSELTPVVGLTYQPKVGYYFRELQMPERTLSFDDFTVANLTDHICNGWRDRDVLAAKLKQEIPRLQFKARLSAEWVSALDRGRPEFDRVWH